MKNYDCITGCLTLLNKYIVEFVHECLSKHYGEAWWEKGVYNSLSNNRQKDIPIDGSDEKLKQSLDLLLCLILIDCHWKDVFSKRLKSSSRIHIKETINIRNRWAHVGINDFSEDETLRMLDTISLLADEINPSNEIRFIYSSYKDSIFIKRIVIPVDERMLKLLLGSSSHPYEIKFDDNKIIIWEPIFPHPILLSLQTAYRGLRKVTTNKPFNLNITLIPISTHGRVMNFECNSYRMLKFFKESNYLKYNGNILTLDFNFFENIKVNKTGDIQNYSFEGNRMYLEIGKL